VQEPAPNISMEIEDQDEHEQPPPPGEERGEENELVDTAMIVGEKNQVEEVKSQICDMPLMSASEEKFTAEDSEAESFEQTVSADNLFSQALEEEEPQARQLSGRMAASTQIIPDRPPPPTENFEQTFSAYEASTMDKLVTTREEKTTVELEKEKQEKQERVVKQIKKQTDWWMAELQKKKNRKNKSAVQNEEVVTRRETLRKTKSREESGVQRSTKSRAISSGNVIKVKFCGKDVPMIA